MMGWIVLAVIALASFGALWALGLPRSLSAFAGAALMLGAAGYALQSNTGLPGAPVEAAKKARPDDAMLHDLRSAMFGKFTSNDNYFYGSDALIRGGDPERAAKFMLGGVRSSPNDAALWTWLGVVLTESDGGTISPAAALAFRRAMTLAPDHPGPRFFYGLSHVRAGNLAAARPLWAAALKVTPEGASYRNEIAQRLALLDQFLAMQAREGLPAAPAE